MKKVTLAIVTAIVAGVAFGTLTATGAWKLGDFGNNAALSTQALTPAEKGGLIGMVQYTLKDSDGNIKYETVVKNLIVDGGEDIIQKAFSGGIAVGDILNTICAGEGGATAATENGAGAILVDPVDLGTTNDVCKEDASPLIGTQIGATPQTVEVDQTWTGGTDFAAGEIVSEAILGDTDSAGAPTAAQTFSRQTFAGITVASGDSLTIKWTITIAEP